MSPEELVEVAVNALVEERQSVKIDGEELTRPQLSARLNDHGFHLLDVDWHGKRQTAVLAGQMGTVLGRSVFFIGRPEQPHPYICAGYSPVLSIGIDPLIVGDTSGLEEEVRSEAPSVEFGDSTRWCRLFVAARSMDNEPYLPEGVGWLAQGKRSARHLAQRRFPIALASDGYFGEAAFHHSLTEGLLDPGDQDLSVVVATAIVAAWQSRSQLRMGWFWGCVAAPILQARSRSELRLWRSRARQLVIDASLRRMELRLEILAEHLDRPFATQTEFEAHFDAIVSRPDIESRLASAEDDVAHWTVAAFRRVFSRTRSYSTGKSFRQAVFPHLARLATGRIRRGGRAPPG